MRSPTSLRLRYLAVLISGLPTDSRTLRRPCRRFRPRWPDRRWRE
nr:MAG TPA: protein of unknown function (DUF5361) [Caudoviricetes sp.]